MGSLRTTVYITYLIEVLYPRSKRQSF